MLQKMRNKRYIPAILAIALVLFAIVVYLIVFPLGSHIANAIGLDQPDVASKSIATPTPKPTPTPTPMPLQTVQAQAAYVMDSNTNKVLAEINSQQVLPMASVTKIMTALVAIKYGNMDSLIEIQQDAADRVKVNGASGALLVVGDKIPLQDLLHGLLLVSASDAAVAIADYEGGQELFVQRMNDMAANLHVNSAHFVNVDGLTEDNNTENKTTAADLTKLAQAAMQNDLFASIVREANYNVSATINHHAYSWQNIDPLLGVYPGLIGVKTGFTQFAGYCMAFAAKRDNHYVIGAVLNSPSASVRDQDVTTLLDLGFVAEAKS